MKQHRFLLLLGTEALCAVILYLLPLSGLSVITTIFAFPWELVGMGLRALSLSGSAGNCPLSRIDGQKNIRYNGKERGQKNGKQT